MSISLYFPLGVPADLRAWNKIYLALRKNIFSLKGKYN